MWYMGGKIRQSRAITEKLTRLHSDERTYIEPFCGALGCAEKAIPALAKAGIKNFILSDTSEALITMWRFVIAGWNPPSKVSEEEYAHHKSVRDPLDPMTAYCGFAMSFGGKWFAAFARSGDRTPRNQINQRDATLRKADAIRPHNPVITFCDYTEYTGVENALVYLDPPYEKRTKAHNFDGFSTTNFWAWAEVLSRRNCVIATGFEAPNNWETVHSWGHTVVHHNKNKVASKVDERVFKFGGG